MRRRGGPPYEALFLDRDGTLIVERGSLGDPKGVRMSRGALARLKRFTDAGTLVFLVTNQSGLARGLLTWEQVSAVNEEVLGRCRRAGVRLAGVLICPHHPEGKVPELSRRCRCRKPGTALHRSALKRHGLSAERCAVVGDKWDDVGAGVALGCVAAHVLTGFGRKQRRRVVERAPEAVLARTLAEALDRLWERAEPTRSARLRAPR